MILLGEKIWIFNKKTIFNHFLLASTSLNEVYSRCKLNIFGGNKLDLLTTGQFLEKMLKVSPVDIADFFKQEKITFLKEIKMSIM